MSTFADKIDGSKSLLSFESDSNQILLINKCIPEELLGELLCYVDYKSLLNCQLVCKRWKELIQKYVWRKKAELNVGHTLQCLSGMPWTAYYKICKKNPFDRNLIKNNSGQEGLDKHWVITRQGGDNWLVESPPSGVPPLPDDPIFEGKSSCFVTSYHLCKKQQTVDLIDEGLSPVLLDTLQPPIQVGEWFSSRWDCPAKYECMVSLLDKDDKELKLYRFRENLKDDKQMEWLHFNYEFTNYGPGVRKVVFKHGGKDSLYWAGHYGSKMAGASVIVKLDSKKFANASKKRRFVSKIKDFNFQCLSSGDNGSVLSGKYIPDDLLGELLCYVDYKSLLNCQLVCKKWKLLIRECVLRKKAELIFGQSLKSLTDVDNHWIVYYNVCKKDPFGRNLLKNNSGQDGLDKHWVITQQGEDNDWRVESPPVGVPSLPSDPILEGINICFASSLDVCTKQQLVDLIDAGLSAVILDTFQPPIQVSEWYGCRLNCPVYYGCVVKLLDDNDKELMAYRFEDDLADNDVQNKWLHFDYEFKNYGPGVRKVLFEHTGAATSFWTRHYGCKMAGASVIVKI
ncbi:uncharacterized protein LOC130663360 isoform X1 [Microplitis mediator]|uniref:uncharacterized protein LOC130663360 isoform X1 n=2 Tax=Microplitis mediator TaxID=375433 RepID=UPI00255228ED|nr:uncharacterized protein LOC130663360 isoform X1 [Microplitis mediator]